MIATTFLSEARDVQIQRSSLTNFRTYKMKTCGYKSLLNNFKNCKKLQNGQKCCKLSLTEKLFITKGIDKNLLNSSSEISAKFRHKKMYIELSEISANFIILKLKLLTKMIFIEVIGDIQKLWFIYLGALNIGCKITLNVSVRWQAHLRDPKPNPNPPKPSFFKKNSFKSPKNSKNRVYLQWTLYQLVTNRPKSRFSAAKKIGFLIK